MNPIVEYPLETGGLVRVELREAVPQDGIRSRSTGLVLRAKETFESTLESIKPAVVALARVMDSLPERPAETSFEFGIRLTAEAGALIASTAAEAHVTVRLVWKHSAS